jgi:hypothetical protein
MIGAVINRPEQPSLEKICLASSPGHTFGASLQHGQPELMAVVHPVRLLDVELDRAGTLLCFLGNDECPAALGDEDPGVLNRELRIIDAPTDFPARLEGIDRASDGKTERLPK